MSELLSINVSLPKTVPYRDGEMSTGIYKDPIQGAVMLRELNLDGDGQADLNAHGGIYKAVYVYSYDHYAYWQDKRDGDALSYGVFGENFTVKGMLETNVYIGDIFEIGQARVQVTQPRVPCFKLAHKMGDKKFQRAFLQSHKVGFYLRVLKEGVVEAGQSFQLVQQANVKISVHDINHLLYADGKNADLARQALQVEALSPGWVGSMKQIVEKYGS